MVIHSLAVLNFSNLGQCVSVVANFVVCIKKGLFLIFHMLCIMIPSFNIQPNNLQQETSHSAAARLDCGGSSRTCFLSAKVVHSH